MLQKDRRLAAQAASRSIRPELEGVSVEGRSSSPTGCFGGGCPSLPEALRAFLDPKVLRVQKLESPRVQAPFSEFRSLSTHPPRQRNLPSTEPPLDTGPCVGPQEGLGRAAPGGSGHLSLATAAQPGDEQQDDMKKSLFMNVSTC